MAKKLRVALYGASGHTGQLVAAELVERGYTPLLAGRNRNALQRVAEGLNGAATIATAEVGDTVALHAMFHGADVVINCAGPHADTSFALALAAIDRGAHYLDTNAVEQLAARRLFDNLGRAAERAGVVLVPGLATFGGLGDLLASRLTSGMGKVTTIAAAYRVDGWIPTRGSMMTASRTQGEPRLRYESGQFTTALESPKIGVFDFGPDLGPLAVVENYPGVDMATIPQHTDACDVAIHMALSTIQAFRSIDPAMAAGTGAEARKMTEFSVLVEARHGDDVRRIIAHGKDIYGFTATMLGTAVDRLRDDLPVAGALAPAMAFEAHGFLDALAAQGLTIHDIPETERSREAS
ncbi:saccharopine dehydrogenase NADP-binding domain-containing protein [Luteibacter yeojuensis]|uniref:NAD(P)H-binding protein n=1 Tax=Luteibacter yeojuensis TaxID=345309 RepID=A0A7X5QSG6_9GAMM|nr:saccharopine dehydrogenase NADP-binding domain-containing protein [Luteibacter yeojuensis]NID14593.1 NAD(P)H-binding protein [Luteibacter yeojuensis]